MAREWIDWLAMAREFIREARGLVEIGGSVGMAFFAHQAAESALKAVWIHAGDGNAPRSHSLVELSTGLAAPEEIIEACRELNPLYMTSRYPDAANGSPIGQISSTQAGRAIDLAEQVVLWCEEQLGDGEGHPDAS